MQVVVTYATQPVVVGLGFGPKNYQISLNTPKNIHAYKVTLSRNSLLRHKYNEIIPWRIYCLTN